MDSRLMFRTAILCLPILLGSISPVLAEDIVFTESPRQMQLFPRDQLDSADVEFAGHVASPGHDDIRLELYRDGEPWRMDDELLFYDVPDSAPFRLSCRIHAELAEYSARLYLDDSLYVVRDSILCGDAFLIDGQSNAEAYDFEGLATGSSEWFRTFGTTYPSAFPCLADSFWSIAQGRSSWTHAAVGVWGLELGLSLVEEYGIPVAFINGAVGGTFIEEHLRNDSYPPDMSTIYGRLLWRARKAGVADAVRAILWHQGESDSGDEWVYYRDRFKCLSDAWREDYGSPEKYYVFQIHTGCGGAYQSELREVQRGLAAVIENLDVMSTMGLPGHDDCHYLYDGYRMMALWISRLIARDFYGSPDVWSITAPDVLEAYYTGPSHDQIRVVFDTEVVWPSDTLGVSMCDYFFLDGEHGLVETGEVDTGGFDVLLRLSAPGAATHLTYLPGCYYHSPPGGVYQGPWIRNLRGVGALSFHDVPIAEPPAAVEEKKGASFHLRGDPNPFGSVTKISFQLPEPARVTLSVYDVTGRVVLTLLTEEETAGRHVVVWRGTDSTGEYLPSGIYFARLLMGSDEYTKRLVLIR